MKNKIKYPVIMILTLALCLSIFVPSSTTYSFSLENQIRVALFVDAGEGYQNTEPYITLNSEHPLVLKGETGDYQNVEQAKRIRFTLDHYFLIVKETSSSTEAQQTAQQLSDQGIEHTILQIFKRNQHYYQVIAGSHAFKEKTKTLQTELNKRGFSSTLAGPYHVQAGQFPSYQEAQQRKNMISLQGYNTSIAQVIVNGQPYFEVWVGNEVDANALSDKQQALRNTFPNISFKPALIEEYIIQRKAVLFSDGMKIIPSYTLSPFSHVTVQAPNFEQPPVITVEERHDRSYRGAIELSRFNNQLTVVNELPLEEYLYSVVGTEMSTGWPLEALKTQAIMSRNYAYMNIKSNKYEVAHLSDTVFEQAYHGYESEADDVRRAVDMTKGQFLTYKGRIFTTFYHSNAGGMTAHGSEVWGFPLAHHSRVSSDDHYPETVQSDWYRVQDSSGKIGYVISDYLVKTTETNAIGLRYAIVNATNLNYRTGPSTDHPTIGSFNPGQRLLIIEEVPQNNSYSWISGPFYGDQLQNWINSQSAQSESILSPITELEITKRGPSGRVLKMEANGQAIMTNSPDAHRQIFKDGDFNLRSTKFEIEAMGEYTILGASGNHISYPQDDKTNSGLYTLKAGNAQPVKVNPGHNQFVILNQSGKLRVASKEPAFRLHGNGFGHGLGASQWGVYFMAKEGYDYLKILKHYFHKDAIIEKHY